MCRREIRSFPAQSPKICTHGKRGCDRRGDHRSAQNLLRLGFRPASAGYHQQPRRGTWPRFLRPVSGLPSPVPSSAMPRCCFSMKLPRHWTLRRNETSSKHHPSASQQNLYRYDAPSECPRPLPESLPCHEWNRDRTRWGREQKISGRF